MRILPRTAFPWYIITLVMGWLCVYSALAFIHHLHGDPSQGRSSLLGFLMGLTLVLAVFSAYRCYKAPFWIPKT